MSTKRGECRVPRLRPAFPGENAARGLAALRSPPARSIPSPPTARALENSSFPLNRTPWGRESLPRAGNEPSFHFTSQRHGEKPVPPRECWNRRRERLIIRRFDVKNLESGLDSRVWIGQTLSTSAAIQHGNKFSDLNSASMTTSRTGQKALIGEGRWLENRSTESR